MRIRTIYYCAVSGLVIAGLAVACPAQQASQEKPAATLKVQAREVLLPVTVRDKKGALVTSLQVSDFTLTEDGRPRGERQASIRHGCRHYQSEVGAGIHGQGSQAGKCPDLPNLR